MLDFSDTIRRELGRKGDAASATGAILARLREFLENRLTATFLSRIDVAVSSRLATVINSIQKGSTTVTGTAGAAVTSTITSVDTTKAYISNNGCEVNPSGGAVQACRVELTNATTVTVTRPIGNTGTGHVVRWTVVEGK